MYPFHQYLKMCRSQKGLSLAQVSKALDISENLLYQYEMNKSFPNGKNLIRLARFYQFSLDDLFDIVSSKSDTPPLYNPLGHQIWREAFPWPDHALFYQLSRDKIVLVKNTRQFRHGQSVLAFYNGKINIFYITHTQSDFYLLSSQGSLIPFDDKNIKMIGTIVQYLTLVE